MLANSTIKYYKHSNENSLYLNQNSIRLNNYNQTINSNSSNENKKNNNEAINKDYLSKLYDINSNYIMENHFPTNNPINNDPKYNTNFSQFENSRDNFSNYSNSETYSTISSQSQNTQLSHDHNTKIYDNSICHSSPLKRLYLRKSQKKRVKNQGSHEFINQQQDSYFPNNHKEIRDILNKTSPSFSKVDNTEDLSGNFKKSLLITKKGYLNSALSIPISICEDSLDKTKANEEYYFDKDSQTFRNYQQKQEYQRLNVCSIPIMNQNQDAAISSLNYDKKINIADFEVNNKSKYLGSSSYRVNLTKSSSPAKIKHTKSLQGKISHLNIIKIKMSIRYRDLNIIKNLYLISFFQLNSIKGILNDLNILWKILWYLGLSDCIALIKSDKNYITNKKLKKIFEKYIFEYLKRHPIINQDELQKFFIFYINMQKLKTLYPKLYQQNLMKISIYERDINQDFDRTFTDNIYFKSNIGRESLKNVLIAISNTLQNVGYIQGMNCIVGTLLLNFNEEQSFWILFYLMEKLGIKQLFCEDFQNINMLNHQLHYFVEYYFPEISNYLDKKGMEIGYFSTAWFITLFSCAFTDKLTMKCWCIFLLKGYPFLIQLALAIFAVHKEDIIERECDEAGDYLKNALKATELKIFEISMKFKVTKRLLDELKQYYNSPKKPSLRLTPVGKKLAWVEFLKINNTRVNPNDNQNERNSIDQLEKYNSKNDENSPRFFDTIVNAIKVDFTGKIKNIFGKEKNVNDEYQLADNQENPSICHINTLMPGVEDFPNDLESKNHSNYYSGILGNPDETKSGFPNTYRNISSLSPQKHRVFQDFPKYLQTEKQSKNTLKDNEKTNDNTFPRNDAILNEKNHYNRIPRDQKSLKKSKTVIFKKSWFGESQVLHDDFKTQKHLDSNPNIDESGIFYPKPEIYDSIVISAFPSSYTTKDKESPLNSKRRIKMSNSGIRSLSKPGNEIKNQSYYSVDLN